MSTTNQTFYVKKGATAIAITSTLTQDDKPFKLSNSDTVKFVMKPEAGGTVKVNADAEVVSAAQGKVKYSWSSSDLNTAGTFQAEWHVTFANGSKAIFPTNEDRRNYLKVVVTDALV